MPDTRETDSPRLQGLRKRWEEDASPSAFVPLAEEFRRLGRVSDALAVLEAGTKAHPSYVSGWVVLGRSRLDAGDAAGAIEALERVVQADPTHMVATKLLVEACLQTGKPRQALERLRVYEAFQGRDPEIEELRGRIDAMTALQPATSPAAPLPAPEAAKAPTPAAPAAGAPPPGDVFDLPPATPAAPAPIFDPPSAPAPSRPRIVAPPPEPQSAPAARAEAEIFAGLGTPEDRQRYVASLVSGEVFGLAQVAAPAPPAASARPSASPVSSPSSAAAASSPAAVPRRSEPSAPPFSQQATVTLGELYLRQGHHQEAGDIFHAIAQADPSNQAAQAGLAQARAHTAGGEGLTARKAQALRDYLGRLRAGERRHVS